MIISTSRAGLAGREEMDVLPTCSMNAIKMSVRGFCSKGSTDWNLIAQWGLWGCIVTFITVGLYGKLQEGTSDMGFQLA